GGCTMTERILARITPGRVSSLLAHAILVLAAIWLAGPFLWEVLTAFKTLTEATSVPPTWLPAQWRVGELYAALPGSPRAVDAVQQRHHHAGADRWPGAVLRDGRLRLRPAALPRPQPAVRALPVGPDGARPAARHTAVPAHPVAAPAQHGPRAVPARHVRR